MKVQNYKELIVWQKSVRLVIRIYNITEIFPKSELYGLTSQMRRSAVSVPANIAEGWHRGTRKDYKHFLTISLGSCAELETQLIISKKLIFTDQENFMETESQLVEIMKMLKSIINKLS